MDLAAVGALFALVLLDAALSGFRAAAGRSARLDKRAHYTRAMLAGALLGTLLAALVAGAALALGSRTATPLAFWLNVRHVVVHLLWAFGPIAVGALALLSVRVVPSVDARSVASTLVFGPLTLLRPLVIVAGCAWAISDRVPANVAMLAIAGCGGMLFVTSLVRRLTPSPPVARRGTE